MGSRIGSRLEGQCVSGIKQVDMRLEQECLVITQGFSLVAFEIFNWCNRSLRIYSSDPDSRFRESLPEAAVWEDTLDLTSVDLCILEGNLKFIEGVLSSQDQRRLAQLKIAIVAPRARTRGVLWKRLNITWNHICHDTIGGVSTSRWMVGLNFAGGRLDAKTVSQSWGLQRTLKDIVKHGHLGTPVPREDAKSLGKDLNQHLALEQFVNSTFVLPSYMCHSGWTRRELTPFEITQVWDVPELLGKRLSGHCKVTTDLPFLHNAPGKVHQVLVHWIMLALGTTTPVTSCYMVLQGKESKVQLLEDGNKLVDLSNKQEDDYIRQYGAKAAKDDDAAIPVELWNGYVFRTCFPTGTYQHHIHGRAFDVLRSGMLRRYRINLWRSFRRFMIHKYGTHWACLSSRKKRKRGSQQDTVKSEWCKDKTIGRDALTRANSATWWEWTEGSTLFHWRWPSHMQLEARDGVNVFVEGKLPHYTTRQRWPPEDEKGSVQQMKRKLQKVIDRGYLSKGYVKSLTNYFSVPKGLQDIRMVYDGTKSKLNAAVWAPNFFLPSVDSLLMFCTAGTWFADIDIGEMFLNYFMDLKIRPYSGVDVSKLHGTKNG